MRDKIRFPKSSKIHVFCIILAGWFLLDNALEQWASNYATSEVEHVQKKKTALVLGASMYLKDGRLNYYLVSRLEAAIDLYEQDKIEYIVVSGDNSRADYNEPKDMKAYLVKRGIPKKAIYCDYAGFRTLDSVVRCKEIFCADDVIIVSQKFHNIRALALAKAKGLEAVAYNAKTYGNGHVIREKLARVKMAIDLLLRVEPKYYGEQICVGQT
jgi:SanA protein